MIYLVEFEAHDPATSAVVTERFATDGYNTSRTDTPADTHWEERVINPGNYEQSVFDDGTTSGEARVGYGYIELTIGDDGAGNNLDRLTRYAVDGRRLTIYALEATSSAWASRVTVFTGTMEQIEYGWNIATIRIKDRLEDLRTPIQDVKYAGTTINGTFTNAEGTPEDLKEKPKPLVWGVVRNVPAVLSNRFYTVFDIGLNGLSAIQAVRDNGVALTYGANYSTLAALVAATITSGQYGTCLATGQIKLGNPPAGTVTVDATEGAAGQRSAARTVRRILESSGFVAGSDFNAASLDDMHTLNPAEVGIWVPPEEREVLPTITQLLDSIGAFAVPDALGVLQFGRVEILEDPEGPVVDTTIILDKGAGIERTVTNDQNNGVPAWKVTLNYAPAWIVQREADLDRTGATEVVKAFSTNQYRTVTAENAAVKTAHLHAAELTFNTLLASEADAQAEANRRLALYSVRRDRYRVPLKAEMAEGIALGSIVTLKLNRFGLQAGKPIMVIGVDTVLPSRSGNSVQAGIITLDLFG